MNIADRFKYYPPKNEKIVELHTNVRANSEFLATWIEENLPDTRERSLAITKIEEAMMWANACIARHMSRITSDSESS